MATIKKPKYQPSKASLYAYHMQAIEPNNAAINAAFPEYHPMWIIQSQGKTVSADNFKLIREHMLKMTRHQCAAYLRASESAVRRCEKGSMPVPFMAFELLRLVYESANFRLSNQTWHGWFISSEGRLVSLDRGNLSFTRHDLSFIRETHQAKAIYESENSRLRAEIEPLRAEVAESRAAAGNDGLLDELIAIEARLAELSTRVGSDKVVRMVNSNKITDITLEARVA